MNSIRVFRIVISLILAVIWLGVIPVYSGPFSGCEVMGYSTFNSGCSSWPETLRGFGFVLLISVISPHTFKIHYISLGIAFFITALGGFELIMVNEFPSNFQDVVNSFIGALPFLYGAIFAVLVYLFLYHLWKKIEHIYKKA